METQEFLYLICIYVSWYSSKQKIEVVLWLFFSDYEIVTVTGDKNGASTNANVYITIEGRSGVTPKIHLKDFTRTNFRQNSSDTFKIRANCVGPMKKIRIEHDNTGIGAGWYLERVGILGIMLKHCLNEWL